MNATDKDLRVMKLNATPVVKWAVAVSSLIGRILPIRSGSSLFFFFPFCHVGGAEKVHAAVVGCFAQEHPWVFFTKKSANKGFLSLFGSRARLFDIWQLLKYGYPFSVGIMAGFINRHKGAVVFGSNSLFYYLLLPYLRDEVKCVDLMHAFGGGSEDFSLPVAGELDARVAINSKTVSDFKEQYLRHGLPAELGQRVHLIENFVPVPERYVPKSTGPELKVLYVGRGSEEKRVHLVGKIASRCRRGGVPIEVVVVGDAAHAVAEEDREVCRFLGEISDPAELRRIYQDADLLLLTSSREGFPMVIMEAMANGVVPISTNVGGIPVHVVPGENGWLVDGGADEEQIVEEMSQLIERMSKDRQLLTAMSQAAYDYAVSHFGGDKFCEAYRALLLQPATR